MDLLTVFAASFIALGGLFASYVTYEFRKQTKEYSEKTLELNSLIKEITKKNQYLITGGDSYPIITFGYNEVYRHHSLSVGTNGKYPIRDLRITIRDNIGYRLGIEEYRSKGKEPTMSQNGAISKKNTYFMEIKNLYRDRPQIQLNKEIMDKIFSSNRKTVSILINMEAENFVSTELIKINDIWGANIQGRRLKRNGKVFESLDDDFPRRQDGEIDFTIYSSDLN